MSHETLRSSEAQNRNLCTRYRDLPIRGAAFALLFQCFCRDVDPCIVNAVFVPPIPGYRLTAAFNRLCGISAARAQDRYPRSIGASSDQ